MKVVIILFVFICNFIVKSSILCNCIMLILDVLKKKRKKKEMKKKKKFNLVLC